MASSETLLTKYPSLKKFEELGDEYVEWKDGREQALLQYIEQRSDFESFRGNPAKLLAAMDDFANQQDFLINIGNDKGSIVTRIIREERPRVFVELGGYMGYSAILFADQMRQVAADPSKVQFWSLEFEESFAEIARQFIDIAGLSDVVTVVLGPADESVRKMKADGRLEHIDMLFLDHVEDLYEQDLKVCEDAGLLRPGACIVADNVLRPGAPKYREYVRSHAGYQSKGMKGLIVPGDFEVSRRTTPLL
ncbi:hypothetical protein M433DRAFT_154970 [Acidomyces richmondensis BFW]|nr:MAG: hypothetical protein FE78DRAFT_150027 [Acidomyces sp. 'richmondensis']KYG45017.1 hypothetical protein M433DRAFT_154970 [Acidomyces richmondensis BFW]